MKKKKKVILGKWHLRQEFYHANLVRIILDFVY